MFFKGILKHRMPWMRMWHVCWNCRFMTKPEKMYDIVNEYKSANLSCPSDQEEFRRAGSFKMTKHDKKWKNNLFLLFFAHVCSFLLFFALFCSFLLIFCSFLLIFALFCSFLLFFALFCSFLLAIHIYVLSPWLFVAHVCSFLLISALFCSFLFFFCFFFVCFVFFCFFLLFFVVVCWKNDKMLSTWTRATDLISPDLMGNLDLLNKLLIYMYIYINKIPCENERSAKSVYISFANPSVSPVMTNRRFAAWVSRKETFLSRQPLKPMGSWCLLARNLGFFLQEGKPLQIAT